MEIIYRVTKTVPYFNATLDEFKQTVLEGHRYEENIYDIWDLKKPLMMDPRNILLKIGKTQHLEWQLPYDLATYAGFSYLQLKIYFVLAMAKARQDNFENANMSVYDYELFDIRSLMYKQSKKFSFVPKNSRENVIGQNSDNNN